jgi:hypothetical protein
MVSNTVILILCSLFFLNKSHYVFQASLELVIFFSHFVIKMLRLQCVPLSQVIQSSYSLFPSQQQVERRSQWAKTLVDLRYISVHSPLYSIGTKPKTGFMLHFEID